MKEAYLDNECYFYQITERDSEKYISIDGYYYQADADFGNGPDRSVAFSGLEMTLAEFVDDVRQKISEGIIEDLAEDCKQYYQEVSFEKEDSFYNGAVAKELPFSDITIDTPAGCYVDYNPELEKANEEDLER